MQFSFLMCVNKRIPFLNEAIESVLNQTDRDFQFYIIANNCSDELWNELNNYADPRIVLRRTHIGQLSFNLNYGLNLIGTGYALRMDADDISLPKRLERTKAFILENAFPDMVAADALLIDQSGTVIGENKLPSHDKDFKELLWLRNPITHPATAIKVESIFRLRGYLGGLMSEDYDLWLRAARDSNFVIRGLREPLLKYRLSADQTRGNVLAYSEVAGHFAREALLTGQPRYFLGFFLAVLKRFFRSHT